MKNYKEHGLSREEREQQQRDIIDLRPYILALKKRDNGYIGCEECKVVTDKVDIHHLSYKPDLTYYDLQLLCEKCHKAVTDYSRVS